MKKVQVHFHWPSCVNHPVERWVYIAYIPIKHRCLYFHAINIYTTMSSASKEVVIEDGVSELGLEECSVMQYLR